jgi:hypothetical protein
MNYRETTASQIAKADWDTVWDLYMQALDIADNCHGTPRFKLLRGSKFDAIKARLSELGYCHKTGEMK